MNGYPECIKQKMQKGKKGKKKWNNQSKANLVGHATPFDFYGDSDGSEIGMKQIVKKEVQRYLSGKGNLEAGCSAMYAGFVGNVLEYVIINYENDHWIIDSGATSHMYAKLVNFTQYTTRKIARTIILPDSTIQQIKHVGTICFNEKFELKIILHVPTFKFNLLSVGQLLREFEIAIRFQPGYYVL